MKLPTFVIHVNRIQNPTLQRFLMNVHRETKGLSIFPPRLLTLSIMWRRLVSFTLRPIFTWDKSLWFPLARMRIHCKRQVVKYEGVSKIFGTDAVKFINLTTKRVRKLPTSTQLRATWHTDSLDMVVLSSTGASSYHNCCIDGGTSPEYFGYTLVCFYNSSRCYSENSKRHADALCGQNREL
jgi:hypothetical protein